MESEWENDTVYNVMEMLNVSVVSNTKSTSIGSTNKDKPSENPQSWGDHNDKKQQEEDVSFFDDQKDQELVYQCMTLGADLLLCRNENAQLTQNVSALTGANKKLQCENADLLEKLRKLQMFSLEFQKELSTFMALFVSKIGKRSKRLELEPEKIGQLLKKLNKVRKKIPLRKLIDWSVVKKDFQQVNQVLKADMFNKTKPYSAKQRDKVRLTAAIVSRTSVVPASVSTEEISGSSYSSSIPSNNDNIKDVTDDIEILEEIFTALPQTQLAVVNQNPAVSPIPPSYFDTTFPNTCVLCGLNCTSFLLQHTALTHNGCLPCKKTFESPDILANHIQFDHLSRQIPSIHHGPQVPLIPPHCVQPSNHGIVAPHIQSNAWNKCWCGYAFKTRLELLLHILEDIPST